MVSGRRLAVLPAVTPAPDLPGWDPRWSRLVDAVDHSGAVRTWHVLDTAPEGEAIGTLLCVHGNPTWSYLWRGLASAASAVQLGWRVVAVDQLEMGFSERTGAARRLGERVRDLSGLVDALQLSGPVVAVGQDWGGIVVSGWAAAELGRREGRHGGGSRIRLAGLVVANTAASWPADAGAPGGAVCGAGAGGPLVRDVALGRVPAHDAGAAASGAAGGGEGGVPLPLRDGG